MVKKEKKKTTQHYPVKSEGVVKINDEKQVKDFICSKCLNEIKEDERFVLIGTYELKEKAEDNLDVGFVSEYFYHLNCWVEYFNQKVIEKLHTSQSQAMDLIKGNPVFQNLIKNASLLKM